MRTSEHSFKILSHKYKLKFLVILIPLCCNVRFWGIQFSTLNIVVSSWFRCMCIQNFYDISATCVSLCALHCTQLAETGSIRMKRSAKSASYFPDTATKHNNNLSHQLLKWGIQCRNKRGLFFVVNVVSQSGTVIYTCNSLCLFVFGIFC
jgi:hypothetical protein